MEYLQFLSVNFSIMKKKYIFFSLFELLEPIVSRVDKGDWSAMLISISLKCNQSEGYVILLLLRAFFLDTMYTLKLTLDNYISVVDNIDIDFIWNRRNERMMTPA